VAGQLLGPSDLCAPIPEGATPEQCIRAWLDLMATCEQFLLAGLKRENASASDLREAYRRWYAGQMEEHDRMMLHLMERFLRHGGPHAA